MKITLIGAGGCPELFGNKLITNMIECGDAVYFVDGGCTVADELLRRGIDRTKVRAVFTTHCHPDHTAGIFNLVDLINWAWRDCKLKVFYTTQDMIDATRDMVCAVLSASGEFSSDRITLALAEAGRVYSDENITVDYIPTKHFKGGISPSYAILVTEVKSGKRVLFSVTFR